MWFSDFITAMGGLNANTLIFFFVGWLVCMAFYGKVSIERIVNGLNALQTNVLAMLLIAAGAYLEVKGFDKSGGGLMGGGLAILRATPASTPFTKETQNVPPVVKY